MEKRKILLIDDDPDVAKVFNETLMVNGFKGDVYTDPLLALSDIKKNFDKYERIFCDMRMPGKSGIEIAKEIKTSIPSMRVILMSSNEKDFIENDESKTISDGFAIKPKNFDEFVKLISNV